jgi:hypothetical protein
VGRDPVLSEAEKRVEQLNRLPPLPLYLSPLGEWENRESKLRAPIPMSSAILTATGKWFDVLNPDPALIDLADIAGALSKLCRFGGHCHEFYSVAEHSILVSRLVAQRSGATREAVAWALMHDASEAYVADIPRPVKRQIPQYVAIEDTVQKAIAERFRLPWPMPDEVHEADHELLALELRAYMPEQPEQLLPPISNQSLVGTLPKNPLLPKQAEQAFLDEARRLELLSED